MSEPIDRRRFLLRSLTGVAGGALALLAGPEFFITTAGATPVAKGPNLVFDWNFEADTVGSSPRGWTVS